MQSLWGAALLTALALVAGLRLLALHSDPYPLLDWCTGLMTDEGFYLHNARNTLLFGHPRADQFNNMLLSPLLHLAQLALFSLLGVGSLQARLISVGAGLLSLLLLFAALQRAFDTRIALTATLLLGLEHTYLLYNRMALMDTPAALGAVAAFYAFARSHSQPQSRHEGGWLFVCGLLLGLTVISRTLCVYLLGVPLLALLWGFWGRSGGMWRRLGWVYGGVLSLLTLYLLVWYLPHRAELSHMSRYYLTEQILPYSWERLRLNLYHGFLGHTYGVFPYLFRHTPVLFLLALTGVCLWTLNMRGVAGERDSEREDMLRPEPVRYLAAWLACGWGLMLLSSYAPSRYYVSFYPAMAALAAILLWRLPELWDTLRQRRLRAVILRGALIWFIGYHLLKNGLVLSGIRLPLLTQSLLLYGLPVLAALADRMFVSRSDMPTAASRSPLAAFSALFAFWLLFNACWLGHWLGTLRYTQYNLSRWLEQSLPPGSVLLGDVAPGVSMDNRHRPVNVMPKLCNDQQPVEKFAGKPRFIVILDDELKPRERFWLENYPELVAPERRIKAARVIKFPVGVYPVEPLPAGKATSSTSASSLEASGTGRR
jgi:4-amino-4-deoxy-L-arabinose transferase-like glycosyltransferase